MPLHSYQAPPHTWAQLPNNHHLHPWLVRWSREKHGSDLGSKAPSLKITSNDPNLHLFAIRCTGHSILLQGWRRVMLLRRAAVKGPYSGGLVHSPGWEERDL
jgi:hypothetical protein